LRVRVKVFAVLRDELGWKERDVDIADGARLRDLLDELGRLRDIILVGGELHEDYRIFVNGRYIGFLGGLDTVLSDGDVVAIFPAMAGGVLNGYL